MRDKRKLFLLNFTKDCSSFWKIMSPIARQLKELESQIRSHLYFVFLAIIFMMILWIGSICGCAYAGL